MGYRSGRSAVVGYRLDIELRGHSFMKYGGDYGMDAGE
jgi:hypothetical protein